MGFEAGCVIARTRLSEEENFNEALQGDAFCRTFPFVCASYSFYLLSSCGLSPTGCYELACESGGGEGILRFLNECRTQT